MGLTELGLVHRNCGCLQSSSHTGNNAANDEMRNVVRCALKDRTDDNCSCCEPNNLSTTKRVSDPEVDYKHVSGRPCTFTSLCDNAGSEDIVLTEATK